MGSGNRECSQIDGGSAVNYELLPKLLAQAQKLTLDEQLQLTTEIEQMVRQHPPEESKRRLWKTIRDRQSEIIVLAA